jgi:SAM-dependent methyltransferase
VTGTVPVFLHRMRRALRRRGVTGVFGEALHRFVAIRSGRRQRLRDRRFDREHGVDTARIVHLRALEIASENRELGVRYQATNPSLFRERMASLPIDYLDYVFVDFGSGKGRALMLASEFPFRRIVGVEFSAELTEIARRNLHSYRSELRRCENVELVCTDAVEYEIPDEPVVLYFYNPFDEPVLRRVLARIRASLDARPRPAFVVTTGETSGQAIEEAGFRPLEGTGVYAWAAVDAGSFRHQASSSQPSS